MRLVCSKTHAFWWFEGMRIQWNSILTHVFFNIFSPWHASVSILGKSVFVLCFYCRFLRFHWKLPVNMNHYLRLGSAPGAFLRVMQRVNKLCVSLYIYVCIYIYVYIHIHFISFSLSFSLSSFVHTYIYMCDTYVCV